MSAEGNGPSPTPPRPPPGYGYAAAAAAKPPAAASCDLGAKLAQTLQEHTANRDRIRRSIDRETSQLQRLFKTTPKRPRETRNALQQKAKKLERDRTSRSLPLAQEKALIRQINAAEKEIRQHDQAEQHQQLVIKKKAEIESARAALRSLNETIAGIESSLSKVELAKSLGCLPAEVISREIDCPMKLLAYVQGVDRANFNAIEESAGVAIKLDKIRGKIEVRGNASAVEEAIHQLEVYTKAVDEETNVSPDAMSYLLSQQSALLKRIRNDNPDVQVDVLSNAGRIKLRGLPERMQKAKDAVGSVQVVSKSRLLVGREVALIVGKAGNTIHSFSEKHHVVMSLSNDGKEKSTLRIVGPAESVAAATADVDKLLFDTEEVVESIDIDPVLKSELLAKSGAGIDVFQSSLASHLGGGAVSLVFDRSIPKDQSPKILLKCNRCVMERARSLATRKIEEMSKSVISIDIPKDMIHVIIGKGGATIDGLRKVGKGATVELDASEVAIKVFSTDAATREEIRERIGQIVAENQIGSIPIEKVSIPFLLGESGKDVREACAELGCNMRVSDDDTKLTLKGTNEQIEQASTMLKDFLATNHIVEMDIDSDEEPLLFVGGSDSILRKVETSRDVTAAYRRGNNKLHIRGEADKVQAAVADIQSFLSGGDGITVCRLTVPESAIGGVIGKGGSNISQLEAEFEGVTVHIKNGSNAVTIRGPDTLVKQCRTRLMTTIASSRVSKTIDISPEQHKKLSRSDAIKRVSRFANVHIIPMETSLLVRGTTHDVRDATASINELLTGLYSSYIDLSDKQYRIVQCAASKDPSHFERIRASTGADIALDANGFAIQITGKKSSVKKAKTSVMELLDFMLPRQLETVTIHRSLFKSMGNPQRLAEIAAETGASVSLDRDLGCILMRSDDPDDLVKATALVKGLMMECQKLNAIVRFEASDAWLLPEIIGKGGSTIRQLEEESGCTIEVLKDEVAIVLSADSEEAVQAGKEAVEEVTTRANKECAFIDLPESSMAAFVGRGGKGIKKFTADHDVAVERTKKSPATIKITGKEDCVASARDAVATWIDEWEASHAGIKLEVKKQHIPLILGKGGETVRSIEKAHRECRVDINREQLTLTVRGGSEADRESAMTKIKEIVDREEAEVAECSAAKEKIRKEQALAIEEARSEAESEPADAQPGHITTEMPTGVGKNEQTNEVTKVRDDFETATTKGSVDSESEGSEETSDIGDPVEAVDSVPSEENSLEQPKVTVEDEEQQLYRAILSAKDGNSNIIDTTSPNTDSGSPLDLRDKVDGRLQEIIAERDIANRRMDLETSQLQQLIKGAPKRPWETRSISQQKAKKLERDRTSRSLPLSQEKALLRQIEASQRTIREHDQVDQHQRLVTKKKAEIESAREALRTLNETIDGIESSLSKVDLAKSLGCLPSEVISREIDFPVSKLAWVMGEDGANIKRIEDTTRVCIDVDKSRGKIAVRGIESATNEAVVALEVYTLAVDEQVKVSPDAMSYLLSQQSALLNKIRNDNPGVQIDVLSNINRIKMRGHPDRVRKVKDAIGGIYIVSKSRVLVDSEVALVIGKDGSAIHSFSEKHHVAMNVSKDGSNKSKICIVGPAEFVDAAMADVDKVLFDYDQAIFADATQPVVETNCS